MMKRMLNVRKVMCEDGLQEFVVEEGNGGLAVVAPTHRFQRPPTASSLRVRVTTDFSQDANPYKQDWSSVDKLLEFAKNINTDPEGLRRGKYNASALVTQGQRGFNHFVS